MVNFSLAQIRNMEMLQKEDKKRYQSDVGIILVGIILGIIFWLLESAVHVLVFHDMSFLEQIFNPEPHEAWMRLTIVAMFLGFGIYSQWIISARWRAEREAKRANMELKQIFDTAADAMRVVDSDFNTVRVNETFVALSGTTKEEAIGSKCYEVFRGPLCHTKDCPLVCILENNRRVEHDVEKTRKDGNKIPCIVSATPFRGPEGHIIGIVEDFKNISERKKSEQALIQSHERLRELTSHLQVVREDERALIAREIHDELGQALTALKMDVHWLRKRLSGEKQGLIDKADAMSGLIDSTVYSVRRICAELRPRLLDDFGLSAAIEWEAEEFAKRTDIECEIHSDPEDMTLSHEISTAIFRIFQEALTNIARHANATRVEILLKRNHGRVRMIVRDDGKGINEQEIQNPKSFGIRGIRERVNYLGGKLYILGSGNGTAVDVVIPLDSEGGPDDKDTCGR